MQNAYCQQNRSPHSRGKLRQGGASSPLFSRAPRPWWRRYAESYPTYLLHHSHRSQLKTWQDHTTGSSSMLQNSVDVKHYEYYLNKALSAGRHDSNELAAECQRSYDDLKDVEKSIVKDDDVLDYLIDDNEKKAVEKRAAAAAAQAELAQVEKQGQDLKRDKLMKTGKAKVFVHVTRKAVNNIREALWLDPEDMNDLDKMALLKAKWMADDVIDDVKSFNNGGEADIARILAKMDAGIPQTTQQLSEGKLKE